jgi:hypothetical protein
MSDVAEWFPKLPQPLQNALREDPRRALNLDELDAIVRAGGLTATSTHWVAHEPTGPFTIMESDAEWIEQISE